MFTPSGMTTRSSGSPFSQTLQSGRAKNKRVANLFTPKGKGTSSFLKSQGNRSLQTSQLLEETAGHKVETYGLPLPVLITEVLTTSDRNTEISVSINSSGWAWLVGGRKLFIWRYKQVQHARSVFCKELTLPPSDLAHNSDRVCVIPNNSDHQSASCIAVSPEGIVRYWPNIANEGSSVEISAELRGEECQCVVCLPPFGCLLATTTSSLVLLNIATNKNTLTCHLLKSSQGMFSGIGRRMSSFIFGASPLQPTGAPLQAISVGLTEDDDDFPFYVLSGTQLQKWTVGEGITEKLFYQVDADRMFRESIARKLWDQDSKHLTQLRSWLIDMQSTSTGVVIFGAAVNMDVSLTVNYALAFIDTDIGGTPSALEKLVLLDYQDSFDDELEYQLQNFKLVVPDTQTYCGYVYNKERVLYVPGETEIVDIQAPGGHVLGAGCCDKCAIFFSSSVGLFTISMTQKQDMGLVEETNYDVTRADMSVLAASSSQIQELSMSDDKISRLKGAFLAAMKGNMRQAQASVDELFPVGDHVNSDIDQVVTSLSKDLIDDYPASDPRWAESRQDPSSRTTSLIILNQLNDKVKAHDYIINFLKKVGLWDKLKEVQSRDTKMLTRNALCEHAEKIQAAIALRTQHSTYTALVDAAIKRVLEKRGDFDSMQSLTPQDIFYREVSKVHEIAEALMEYEEDFLAADVTTQDVLTVVSSVNAVLQSMFDKALQYRQNKVSVYQSYVPETLEYTPWTSTSGERGIRTILIKQYTKTYEEALPETGDAEIRDVLFEQLVHLTDIVLDGYRCQLESLRQCNSAHHDQFLKRYEQDRHNMIAPLLEYGKHEMAASLAEKYLDFEILIQLCDDTNNSDRIERYLVQFADKGFADFLYAWYLKKGKRGKLMSLPVSQHAELRSFLQTDNNKYLSWLHDIHTDNYIEAHNTLLDLARLEVGCLAKKKTLLSLSKLAGLAADDPREEVITEDHIDDINREQDLITHQEQLPARVIQHLGMEEDNMRVLQPVEIIQQYISDFNIDANEFDFKKALDLLQYIDKDDENIDFESLRLYIWTRAILRNSWVYDQAIDPQDVIKDTIFFKVIDLAYREGQNLPSFLPELDSLLQSDDLGLLKDDDTFQYLMRAGFEHIQQMAI
ncbi:nuclear pore complex protein Nup133-like isoform X1 [Mytilus californianus]|uniref:nuclear pore complex protein Nup133-like isoform X1 n=1 Tax=Mytilus californianus TaxID=6549 RepID=UPI0022466678|nr:nuclear pore complex protein Nup133-like isoform X1 [Mytilus californianus]